MDVNVKPNVEEAAKTMIASVLEAAGSSIARYGNYIIGLSGGSLIQMLADYLPLEHETFDKWIILFVDERLVDENDKESTYGECRRRIFDQRSQLETSQILHLFSPGMLPLTEPLDNVAQCYEQKFQEFYKLHAKERGYVEDRCGVQWPIIDVLLMGMGPDGHTASLFPYHLLYIKDLERTVHYFNKPLSPAIDHARAFDDHCRLDKEMRSWSALVQNSPKPPPNRITLTLPSIICADKLIFVSCGENKSPALKQIYETLINRTIWHDPEWVHSLLPSAAICLFRRSEKVDWIMDEAAAKLIR